MTRKPKATISGWLASTAKALREPGRGIFPESDGYEESGRKLSSRKFPASSPLLLLASRLFDRSSTSEAAGRLVYLGCLKSRDIPNPGT